jgi:hypothetical protein
VGRIRLVVGFASSAVVVRPTWWSVARVRCWLVRSRRRFPRLSRCRERTPRKRRRDAWRIGALIQTTTPPNVKSVFTAPRRVREPPCRPDVQFGNGRLPAALSPGVIDSCQTMRRSHRRSPPRHGSQGNTPATNQQTRSTRGWRHSARTDGHTREQQGSDSGGPDFRRHRN